MTDSIQSYLEAKRSVDDRALNRRVLERFTAELSGRPEPVRILELGCGVGTMIARLAEWGSLPARVSYRAVDRDAASIERARELVPAWLEASGYTVDRSESATGETVGDGVPKSTTLVARPVDAKDSRTDTSADRSAANADRSDARLEITLEVADAFEIEDEGDAVVAAALLDIVALEDAVPAVADLLADDGLCYAPITYDGATTFAPRDRLDERIEAQYHRHMDDIRDEGSSRAGSALVATLPRHGWDVLAAGGSDWLVRSVEGSYPGDERAVVARVLETMADALEAVPSPELDAGARWRWFDRRWRELEDGDLVYVAHNLDVLARVQ
ncbi:class I SAM-dependent methyltransferase [Natronorubrum sp. FCH18a]|uniref:class I SAM-dependent methyltransferase n=1 Tax=Natronorubrum sp. FCH18a TaxID=3447018 RepID=UPI003F50E9D0